MIHRGLSHPQSKYIFLIIICNFNKNYNRYVTIDGCVSILDHFKSIKATDSKKETLKHWQVVGLSIDLPYEKRYTYLQFDHLEDQFLRYVMIALPNRVFDDLYTVGALDALDLTFMRPKFIQVRVDTTHNPSLDVSDYHYAATHISAALRRHGYSVGSETGRPEGLVVWGLFFNSLQIP